MWHLLLEFYSSVVDKAIINSLKIIFTDVLPIIGHARDP